jgi:hypothetical protein
LAKFTFVRRLLILLCIVGIFVCLVLHLATARKGGGDKTVSDVGNIKIYVKSEEESTKIIGTLKSAGFDGQKKTEDGTKKKLKGHVLVCKFRSDLISQIAEYLKKNNYKVTIKESPDQEGWSMCQVGQVFTSKAQAAAVGKKINTELGVVFTAEPIYDEIKTKVHFVEVEKVSESASEELRQKFKDKSEEEFKWVPAE